MVTSVTLFSWCARAMTRSMANHRIQERVLETQDDAAPLSRRSPFERRSRVTSGACRTSLLKDEQGGPLAEMAILLLPFMLIIAMVIEGGNILWRHQISLKAVRDATRYVSRTPLLFDDNCRLDDTVLATTIASAKQLGSTGLLQGGSALLPGWTAENIEIARPTVIRRDPCLAAVQAAASVDLPLPFAPIFRVFNPAFGNVLTFTVQDRTRWLGE